MPSNAAITPSTLSPKDLPWQIEWAKDKCTLCGQCTTVCPVRAIELGTHRKREVKVSLGLGKRSENQYSIYHGIRQKTDPANACVGCAMCSLVCPNDAIKPMHSDEQSKLAMHVNRGGGARTRGGRRNDKGSLLDQIKFVRISMLTDPALDAGRHEFDLSTLIGRVLPPEEGLKVFSEEGWMPPVRKIYPLMIGGMSFGALSPNMWEGLQMGVAYLNEELNMPVRMCTGEGGCPPRLLRSRFLKYVHPADRLGLLRLGRDHPRHPRDEGRSLRRGDQVRPGRQARRRRPAHVAQGQQAHRGHPRRTHGRQPALAPHAPDQVLHRGGPWPKMIQSMSMAWGFRVPVYPKISATTTSLAVLNNLARNKYAAGLAIDGEGRRNGRGLQTCP